MLAQLQEWGTQFGPLLVPLVGAWFEQHATRKEIIKLSQSLERLEARHDARISKLEERVGKIEQVVAV